MVDSSSRSFTWFNHLEDYTWVMQRLKAHTGLNGTPTLPVLSGEGSQRDAELINVNKVCQYVTGCSRICIP